MRFSIFFLFFTLILVIFGISNNYVYATSEKVEEEVEEEANNVIVGGEDLILEMQVTDDPIEGDKILQFKIPSTNYTQICPSNQCDIEITFAHLSGPTPDNDSPPISVTIYFNLHDDITNANLTPAQKLFIEKFNFGIYCRISNIDQIVQDPDGNVVYNCVDNAGAYLGPMESSSNLPTLVYSYKVTYDTKSQIMKLNGKLDHIQN